MLNQLKISYENMGASSYLAIIFPPEAAVVGYQLEMITSNEIRHLSAASRRMINGEMAVYYNISSRIRLSQLLERRKLKREELICLVQGALEAIQEGKEYQLAEEGFVMEPDFIYVVPDTCSPSFLYLPVADSGGGSIKEFLLSLIIQGKIEMSSDNFIQVLLETLNSQPFSLEQLAACLERYHSPAAGSAGAGISGGRPGNGGGALYGQMPGGEAGQNQMYAEVGNSMKGNAAGTRWPNGAVGNTAAGSTGQPGRMPGQAEIGTGTDSMPVQAPAWTGSCRDTGRPEGRDGEAAVPKPQRGAVKEEKEKKKEKPQKQKGNGAGAGSKEADSFSEEFNSEKAKKKFLIPQAGIMVALAAMVSFGAFTDEKGGIVLNNILAVILIVAVAEIILYREIYINSRTKGTKKGSAGNQKMAKAKEIPGRGKKEADLLKPAPVGGPDRRPKPPLPSEMGYRGQKTEGPSAAKGNGYGPYDQPASLPFVSPPGTALSSDTELWDGGEREEAYLEYYENGMLTRVMLEKPGTLVGRLSSQVDFAVSNPKVGKIHAEFLNQNGMIYVTDQNSKNGTYINGSSERISSNIPYPLHDNDRIRLADSEFTLRCSR